MEKQKQKQNIIPQVPTTEVVKKEKTDEEKTRTLVAKTIIENSPETKKISIEQVEMVLQTLVSVGANILSLQNSVWIIKGNISVSTTLLIALFNKNVNSYNLNDNNFDVLSYIQYEEDTNGGKRAYVTSTNKKTGKENKYKSFTYFLEEEKKKKPNSDAWRNHADAMLMTKMARILIMKTFAHILFFEVAGVNFLDEKEDIKQTTPVEEIK